MNEDINNLCPKIVDVIREHFQELKNNPKHLAWCLMIYELAHMSCRISGYDTPNPKDIFLDDQDTFWKGYSEKDLDLIYDAWCCNISDGEYIEDTIHPKYKLNMTIDEWVDLKLDPDYIYKDLYPNRHEVVNNILCVGGTGMQWNKDGFIIECGSASRWNDPIDEFIFSGRTQCESEINPNIKNVLFKIVSDNRISNKFNELYKKNVEYNKLSGKEKRKIKDQVFKDRNKEMFEMIEESKAMLSKYGIDLDKTREDKEKIKDDSLVFYPFSENYCLLDKMPNNADPSYIKEGMRICRLIIEGKAFAWGSNNTDIPASKDMIKVSEKFIAKWEPKGY